MAELPNKQAGRHVRENKQPCNVDRKTGNKHGSNAKGAGGAGRASKNTGGTRRREVA